ncbi:MAG: hypothetical protein J6S79_06205 [Lachnospiraceae bacterium]|nr:hypothetical protein [Lachnospiraceae bacterium]
MRVFDENENLVGYLQEDNGKLVMIGAAEAEEDRGISSHAYAYHTRWYLARELADWFFAGAVITLIGIFLYILMNGRTADLGVMSLILPNSILLMAPLTFALRLVAIFFGTLLDARFVLSFGILLVQILGAGLGYSTDHEIIGTLIVIVLDVLLLYYVRRILKDYLNLLPKNVKDENAIESKFSLIFVLFIVMGQLLAISLLLGGWGDNEYTVLRIIFITFYRGIEAVQFMRVGNLIRKANL